MVEMIEINGKSYSKRTIEILTGMKNFHNLNYNL